MDEENPDCEDGHCPLQEGKENESFLSPRSHGQLTQEEKKFLLSVERGDLATVRRYLQSSRDTGLNVNCVDPLGRSALLMAIDNENLEMVELLILNKVDTKDALLHAISEEYVEAVEVLLEHEEATHAPGELHELRRQCQNFATAVLDHTRSSYELEVLLNYDPTGPAFERGDRMHLSRLKLAIKQKQKKFCAHPNVQQLLASIWYEGLPGFRRKNILLQTLEICRIGTLFPIYSVAYIIAPHSTIGRTLRRPFIKFICHSTSYVTFLFLLILASQRVDSLGTLLGARHPDRENTSDSKNPPNKRGDPPSVVEWMILAWVIGLIWSEIKELWELGLVEYVADMWNILDFITNSLYVATIALRGVAYYQYHKEISSEYGTAHLPREKWDAWDPILIAEGLFAAANIFSH